MNITLKSVKWGKPALSLLTHMKKIDTSRPTMILIRHSETTQDLFQSLTKIGKKAAYDFGVHLTHFNKIRLYHTYLDHTKETAKEIHKALTKNHVNSEITGSLNLRTVNDPKKTEENMSKVLSSYGVEGKLTPEKEKQLWSMPDNPMKRNFLKWVSGHYSPIYIRPSLDFAQQITAILMMNLESAEKGTVILNVCHDNWIAALLLHWCGIIPEVWVEYLAGFAVQPFGEKLRTILPSGQIDVEYPYWWRF
jgi:broad specificity phosphatase PhoE